MNSLASRVEWIKPNYQGGVVLIIDEVDTATNNQVFLDFFGQLRSYYLDREEKGAVTFAFARLYMERSKSKSIKAYPCNHQSKDRSFLSRLKDFNLKAPSKICPVTSFQALKPANPPNPSSNVATRRGINKLPIRKQLPRTGEHAGRGQG